MKILLQERSTRVFYTATGQWTLDPEQALYFPDLPSAIDFVLAFRLHHLQPVLYLTPQQKIDLPPLEPVL